MTNTHRILLFYKFIPLEECTTLMDTQRKIWEELALTGRMIIAPEGINATLEGSYQNTQKYIDIMHQDERFKDLWFKESPGTGHAFKKISIKIREEVCTLGRPDVNPMNKTAQFITHDELHSWYEQKKEFYVVDMRNDYEYEVGHFRDSIFVPGVRHFRDIPKNLSQIEHLRDKTVVPVCTGGIRCEKGSGLLLDMGFSDVYQLHGGIHTYLVNHPDGYWDGKLYVFDGRVLVSFGGNTEKVIGKCRQCGVSTENYVNVEGQGERLHHLMCENCVAQRRKDITFISNT